MFLLRRHGYREPSEHEASCSVRCGSLLRHLYIPIVHCLNYKKSAPDTIVGAVIASVGAGSGSTDCNELNCCTALPDWLARQRWLVVEALAEVAVELMLRT